MLPEFKITYKKNYFQIIHNKSIINALATVFGAWCKPYIYRDLHHAPMVIEIELITRLSILTIARKILPNKGIFLFFFINTVVRPLHSKTITVYLCIDQMTDGT